MMKVDGGNLINKLIEINERASEGAEILQGQNLHIEIRFTGSRGQQPVVAAAIEKGRGKGCDS